MTQLKYEMIIIVEIFPRIKKHCEKTTKSSVSRFKWFHFHPREMSVVRSESEIHNSFVF